MKNKDAYNHRGGNQERKRKPKIRILILATLALGAIVYGAVIGSAQHQPDDAALSAMQSDEITLVSESDDYIRFQPSDASERFTGFLLYPHDDISAKAYAPLAKAISRKFQAEVYVIKYPWHRFWLGVSKGKQVVKQSGQDHWLVLMHGNGGLLSQISAPKNAQALVYLSSYPLFRWKPEAEVMVIRGSMDEVNHPSQWKKKRKQLPKNAVEYEIAAGNFSYFASFGLQGDDSAGGITRETQIEQTLAYLEDFVNGL